MTRNLETTIAEAAAKKLNVMATLESLADIDERQIASWMEQAAAIPGFGKR